MLWTLRAGDSCGGGGWVRMASPSLPRTQGQLPGAAVEGRSPPGSTGRRARGCRRREDTYVHSGALLPEGSRLSRGQGGQPSSEGLRPWTGGCNRAPQALPRRPLLLSWTKSLGVGCTWESAGR